MRLLACVAFLVVALGPGVARAMECAAPVYEIDAQGKVVRGSKAALREAAVRGDALRVGWRFAWGKGPRDGVLHWADAVFVTVFEDDVFTQVPMIHSQAPRPGKSHVMLPDALEHWNASLGSNGLLVGRSSKEVKSSEDRVAQLWCLTGDAAIRCHMPAWRLMYRHDPDGKALAGSKQALVEAIRRGDPIRVTWRIAKKAGGAAGEDQAAEPTFVSITGDKVSAEIAKYLVEPQALRHAVLATDGTFEAMVVEPADSRPKRSPPQRVAAAWFAHAADPQCTSRPPAGAGP